MVHGPIFADAEGSRPDGFLRIDYTPGPKGEKKTSRMLDFAENLFNLQHVEGFDDRVTQMRSGSIEATFAEFDFGRFLYIHDIDFKFVMPSGVAGKDYDYRIRYQTPRGLRGCEMPVRRYRDARGNNLERAAEGEEQ